MMSGSITVPFQIMMLPYYMGMEVETRAHSGYFTEFRELRFHYERKSGVFEVWPTSNGDRT